MHAAAGHQLFSEASLVNQVATGSTWQCKAMVGDTVLHPGTKVAGLFVTRRLSWQCCQSSSTCSRLSPYDYSHQAGAVFENWLPSHIRHNQNLFGVFFSFPSGWLPLSLCIATLLGQCQFPSGTLISATRDQLITANINRRCRKKN
jgi:hypothetical protein